MLVFNPRQSIEILSEKYYPEVPTSDLWENYLAERVLPSTKWIEYYQDGILVREVKVQRYEVDAPIPAELFDIEQLRSAYPPAELVSSDSGESKPVSDVQEAIEEFGKMFE